MKSDGSDVKRISFGNGLYGTPVWSPRGDLIAFTKLHKGKFYIGVMRTDGKGERLLTENYYQEAPSWSPLANSTRQINTALRHTVRGQTRHRNSTQ